MIVQVLGLNLTIDIVDELSGAYGDFSGELLRIRLVRGLQKDVLLTALVHELTHVKQFIFGLEMCEDEANRDAIFWYQFLKSSRFFQRIWKEYNVTTTD